MEIMDVAVMLGKMIKNSEEGRALDLAKAEWAECEELRTAYTEYSAQHRILEMQENSANPEHELMARVTARINELYEFIVKHPAYIKLEEAQNRLNALVQEVNGVIIEQITGTNPNCTHDCSTCGGCN